MAVALCAGPGYQLFCSRSFGSGSSFFSSSGYSVDSCSSSGGVNGSYDLFYNFGFNGFSFGSSSLFFVAACEERHAEHNSKSKY